MSTGSVLSSSRPRTAPFGKTSAIAAVTAVVVLSQLYAAIPLFGPVRSAFGVDAAQVGWVQTAFGIAYAAGFIAWGPLVDRSGPRRIMLVGLSVLALATSATALAPSFPWLLTGRAVQGVFAASFAPAAFAYIGARLPQERRVLSITVLTSSFLSSAVLGQVAAQVVTERLPWQWFFWLGAAVLVLMTVVIGVVFLPDQQPSASADTPLRSLIGLLALRPVLVLLIATVMVLGPMIALYTAVGTSGLADSSTLLALRASALPALVWAPFGIRWLGRIGPHRRLIAAFTASGVAAVAVAFVSDSVIGVAAAMFVVAGAVSVAAPAMIQALTGHAPQAGGSVTALYICFLFVGASVAPSCVTSSGATLTATAIAAGTASAVAAGLVHLTRSRRWVSS